MERSLPALYAHSRRRKALRCGSKASRQATQLCVSRTSSRPAEPGGRAVPGQLQEGLLAEGAACPQRVRGIADDVDAAVGVGDLELVLDPVDGRRSETELPGAVVPDAREVGPEPRPPELLDEADASQAPIRIGDGDDHGR
ncbi:MAG: hypothetical protein ACRDOP_09015 [Gaiellaceae bacterium]